MILDRTIAPDFKLQNSFEFLKAKQEILSNGIEFYSLKNENQRMVKLELVFDAGYSHHQNSIIPTAVSQLLFEGTNSHSSKEIAQLIEANGGFYDASCGPDNMSITAYVLESNIDPILAILNEVIYEANFPKTEIEKYIHIQKQKFLVNKEKVSFIARNQFNDLIYPEGHPYHSAIKLEDFDLIIQESILEFYFEFIVNRPFRLYVSGCISDTIKTSLQKSFGNSEKKTKERTIALPPLKEVDERLNYIEKEGALQSAIRIGGVSISKTHQDYPKLFILNTILGGYFGSRLMMNIREEKGYTYGIGSGIAANRLTASFFISTEVGAEYTEATIQEIEKELNKLKAELIPEEELQLVKNYIIGSLMRNFDGAFDAMDRFKALNELGLTYSYYDNLFEVLNKTTAKELMILSKKYFNFEEMIKVVVGKNKK